MHVVEIAFPHNRVVLQFKGPTAAKAAFDLLRTDALDDVEISDDFGRHISIHTNDAVFVLMTNLEQAQEGNLQVGWIEVETQIKTQQRAQRVAQNGVGGAIAMPARGFHG